MKNTVAILISIIGLGFTGLSVAGPYTVAKDKACPDSWQLNKATVPVIKKSTDHSSTSSYPYKVGSPSSDKTAVQAHINATGVIETIDGTSLTQSDKDQDLLTIASECLMYRNFEVDTHDYVTPPAVEPNVATGWIPAAIF